VQINVKGNERFPAAFAEPTDGLVDPSYHGGFELLLCDVEESFLPCFPMLVAPFLERPDGHATRPRIDLLASKIET
jgi:hypothetical protein